MQSATSVPLLPVDTVVALTGGPNDGTEIATEISCTSGNATKAKPTSSATPSKFVRKAHKSAGGDGDGSECDGAKNVQVQRPPFYRQPSRRSLQLIRGPSRCVYLMNELANV